MNVKVDAEVLRKAKVVAAARRVTLSDYLSELLRPQVEADLKVVVAGLIDAEASAKSPAGGHPADE
jgi:hypothetical protein